VVADQDFPTMSFGSGAAVPQIRRQPFSILLMGQFGLGSPEIHDLSSRDVQALLAARRPKLSVKLPNLFDGKDVISADLSIDSMKEFRIERLAQAFEAIKLAGKIHADLKKGLARPEIMRRYPEATSWACLDEVVDGGGGTETLPEETEYSQISDAPNVDPSRDEGARSDDPLDNIFSMVAERSDGDAAANPEAQLAEEGGAPDAVHRALNAFVGQISRDLAPREGGEWASQALNALEHVLAAQLSLLAEHPTLRMLRRNWLMVSFLLKKLGRSGDVRLHLLDSGDVSLAEAMRTLLINRDDLTPSGLGVMVQLEVLDGPAVPSLLAQYAEIADLIQVPLVTSLGEEILGVQDGKLADTPIKDMYRHAWNMLREKPQSRWLGVTCNGFNLEDEMSLSDLGIIAAVHGAMTISYPCRGSGAAIIAAGIAQCVEETGWPGDLMNAQYAVEGLVMVHDAKTPLLWPMGLADVGQLKGVGVMAFGSTQLRDYLFLASAPSLASDFSDLRDKSMGFVYQLLFRRAVGLIEANYDQLFGLRGAQLCDRLKQIMMTYVVDGRVDVVEMKADDGVDGVIIDVNFGPTVLAGGQIHLEVPLA